jgi:hypothetical protein
MRGRGLRNLGWKRSEERGYPSLLGATLLSTAAFWVTLLALSAIAAWDPNNAPGSVVVAVFATAIAGWVDWRAIVTWRRRLSARREARRRAFK